MPWCHIRGRSPYSFDKWAWQAMSFIGDCGRGSRFRWSWFDCEIFFSQLQRIFDLPARSSSQMYWRFTWRFNLNNGFRWIKGCGVYGKNLYTLGYEINVPVRLLISQILSHRYTFILDGTFIEIGIFLNLNLWTFGMHVMESNDRNWDIECKCIS